MTYYEDLRLVNNFHYMLECYGKCQPDKYIAKEMHDNKGFYWKCFAVFSQSSGIGICAPIVTADTIDELRIWCDLYGIDLYHIEPMAE